MWTSSNYLRAGALGVCIPVFLTGCTSFAEGHSDGQAASPARAGRAEKLTCKELAVEAVKVSEKLDPPRLVKVRKPKVKTDHSNTYKEPKGDKDTLVLSCTGTAVWSTGDTTPVLLKYTVDSDGETFVSYKPSD